MNIAYFQGINENNKTRITLKINGYLDKASRENGATPIEEKQLSYTVSKDGKFNLGELYRNIKLSEEFQDAEDDI